jgi:2,4-dienoyl-CoA reductase-like NADH-dependent reductase (Old Yellow Enzyme family)/thioredoxin reductase
VTTYPHLFQPLDIGGCRIKNRIVSSGHDTIMVLDGRVTEDLIAYHAARARGGVGLIVVQVAGVHESARYTSHVLMAVDDSCIEGYEKLANAVHESGTRIFGQVFHPGREVMESLDGSAPVALAPSQVPNERFHVMPRALSLGEIDEIVAGYAASAERLYRAGLDGVEVVASHGYLPSQFLNPHANQREDEYGGSPENRRRFLRRVLEAVRSNVAEGFVVGLRISIDEHDPSGLEENVALDTIAALDADGLIDYVSVTTGTSATLAGSNHIAPEMHFKSGYTAPMAARVKAVANVPVFVAGRINQPQEAERILASGDADACVMTRALICDPEMPALAQSGDSEEIRACIGCNQACIGHFHAGYPISCIQHPETGRERRFSRLAPAAKSERILVVGGGPAGLKAAAIAAARGHQVTLHEAAAHVGGQVLLAQMLPGRDEFGGAVTNLHREALRAGAEIVVRSNVDLALIDQASPDLVIVATGARPYRPELEILGAPVIRDAWEVLRGESPPVGRTLVLDWRGDWIGVGVARLLAARGHKVTLCVNGYAAAMALQQYVRNEFLAALQRERITVLPLVRPLGVDDDSVYLQHVLTGELIIEPDVTGVVLAYGHQSETRLLHELEDRSMRVVAVGDCLTPRTVEEAVLEGLVAGNSA